MRFFLLVLIVLISCAPKAEKRCEAERVLSEFSSKQPPKNFRIFGAIKYGPLKFPMMFAKFDGFYTIKVARTKDLSIDRNRFCTRDKCYLLPSLPEDIIFGKLLSGREYHLCKDGLLLFRERLGVYDKLVIFSEGRPKEISIRNVKNGKVLRIVFGPMDKEGFFKEIEFITDSSSAKLIVEEVEL